MTETDDKLLKQFFSEQKQEVKDNGFSRRVMRNLPTKPPVDPDMGNGLHSIVRHPVLRLRRSASHYQYAARSFVSMVQHGLTAGFDPKSLYIAILVLAFFGARKVWSMA